MGITIPPQKRRDALLRMPLADLAGWHLLATCPACRQDRIVSVTSLTEHYGAAITLLRLVPRFRCMRCRQPPCLLRLRNRMPVHPGPPLIDVVMLDSRAPPGR